MTRRDLLALAPLATLAALAPGPLLALDAPDFRATSLAKANFTRASLKGKVVLIQFWATWCGFCRRDQPAVDEVYMDLAAKGLEVLAVNAREPEKKVRAYLRESPRMVPVVLTADTNLMDVFPAPGFPTYIVLARDGKVAAAARGGQGQDGFARLLKQAGLSRG